MSNSVKIPALGQTSDRLKFNFCLYRPGRLQAIMAKNPGILSQLIQSGEIGFRVKPIPKHEDDRPEYQAFEFKGFRVLAVVYSIEGYDREPTHSSNLSLSPTGPFRVYARGSGAVEAEGIYRYDEASRTHTINGKALPLSCKRCMYVIGMADGVEGLIRMKVSATLRRAMEAAVINAYKQQGQQPPKYVALRDLCSEAHFWQFTQRTSGGSPQFVATTIDGKVHKGHGDAYMMPVLDAEYITDEGIREEMRQQRKAIEAAFNKPSTESALDEVFTDEVEEAPAVALPAIEAAQSPQVQAAVNDLPF